MLVRPESEEKLEALVAKGDTPVVRATIDDWQALAQTQVALDAYRAALEQGTLEDVEAFTDGLAALPDESLGRAWVDASRLSDDLGQLVEQAGTELDLGFEWLSAALSAEDDGLLLTMGLRMPGGGDSSYEPVLLRLRPPRPSRSSPSAGRRRSSTASRARWMSTSCHESSRSCRDLARRRARRLAGRAWSARSPERRAHPRGDARARPAGPGRGVETLDRLAGGWASARSPAPRAESKFAA